MKTPRVERHSFAESWLSSFIASAFRPSRSARKQGSSRRRAARPDGFAIEPLEPRLLLSADISYAFGVADAGKFNVDDTHLFRLVVQDQSGADVLKLLSEQGDVLASGTLASGVNKVTLTGDALFTDQLLVDFSGIAGQDATLYDIQIAMDGQGDLSPSADEKLEFIGDGGYHLQSLVAEAHEEVIVTGDVVAQGDISVTSTAADDDGLPVAGDLVFTASSLLTMSDAGARLESTGGDISLLAQSTLSIDNSDFSLGPVRAAFAVGVSDAGVQVSAGTITAAGNVNVEAKSTVTSTLTTVPDDTQDDDDSVDAAVASAILHSAPTLTISGGTVHAGGNAVLKATNTVTAGTTADGLTGDKGASVAFNLVTGGTSATLSGGSVDADSVTLQAHSERSAQANAVATVGGANASGSGSNESEKRLRDPNKDGSTADRAKTDEGNMNLAAAVAVGVVTGDTSATITGGTVNATAGNLDVTASGKVTLTSTADGSNKTTASTAVAPAANNVAAADAAPRWAERRTWTARARSGSRAWCPRARSRRPPPPARAAAAWASPARWPSTWTSSTSTPPSAARCRPTAPT